MDNATTSRTTARLTYIAAGLFALDVARYFLLPPEGAGNLLVAGLGAAEHLILFPIVAALPAPPWARAAGYGWLVVDVATSIMALNGVSPAIYLALRYGGQVSAAVWLAAAAWHAGGAARIIGLALAINLGGYSFAAQFDRTHFAGLLPVQLFLPLWLVLMGRHIRPRDLTPPAPLP